MSSVWRCLPKAIEPACRLNARFAGAEEMRFETVRPLGHERSDLGSTPVEINSLTG
jgi:hypothetical protein